MPVAVGVTGPAGVPVSVGVEVGFDVWVGSDVGVAVGGAYCERHFSSRTTATMPPPMLWTAAEAAQFPGRRPEG